LGCCKRPPRGRERNTRLKPTTQDARAQGPQGRKSEGSGRDDRGTIYTEKERRADLLRLREEGAGARHSARGEMEARPPVGHSRDHHLPPPPGKVRKVRAGGGAEGLTCGQEHAVCTPGHPPLPLRAAACLEGGGQALLRELEQRGRSGGTRTQAPGCGRSLRQRHRRDRQKERPPLPDHGLRPFSRAPFVVRRGQGQSGPAGLPSEGGVSGLVGSHYPAWAES
jgi:hypothetical protein